MALERNVWGGAVERHGKGRWCPWVSCDRHTLSVVPSSWNDGRGEREVGLCPRTTRLFAARRVEKPMSSCVNNTEGPKEASRKGLRTPQTSSVLGQRMLPKKDSQQTSKSQGVRYIFKMGAGKL
ncbi:hypothetical protein BS47DRAFT_1354638 [Hydnum rufescens UP504]|uniref:Uncharacterized protein n=1 Tax=Hydnum rufescens UP504 TaxID=1448309 RepID=A0A9P6DNQ8_9AGAM|nr:hypothetical protein BS47DRAFT_1354638 [Hydnum rufescens UP504]